MPDLCPKMIKMFFEWTSLRVTHSTVVNDRCCSLLSLSPWLHEFYFMMMIVLQP